MASNLQQNHALPAYNPGRLLDTLLRQLNLKDDSALSRQLRVAQTIIASIRRGSVPVGASMLLWMHEISGISIDEMRLLMGDRRSTCRLSCLPTA